MASSDSFPLMAVDVGNSRVKLGEFDCRATEGLPFPLRALALGLDWTDHDVAAFLPRGPAGYSWSIASVNRPAASRLIDWLKAREVPRVRVLSYADFPVTVDLARPDLVGLDRLANVVAVNRLRAANRPALVIGFGSAVTVNLISETGALVGGAILPGVAMSARALHDFTDLLPLVEVAEPPLPLGTSTVGAVSSGLYWGMVGAVRELAARLTAGRSALQVFLTGGAASIFSSALAELADGSPQYVPHLTLGGIAIASCGDGSPKGSR